MSNIEPGQLTAKKRFRHSDLVTDFVTVILSLSEGLSKMAVGIVKYAYDHSSQPISVIWFMVSCRGPIKYGPYRTLDKTVWHQLLVTYNFLYIHSYKINQNTFFFSNNFWPCQKCSKNFFA